MPPKAAAGQSRPAAAGGRLSAAEVQRRSSAAQDRVIPPAPARQLFLVSDDPADPLTILLEAERARRVAAQTSSTFEPKSEAAAARVRGRPNGRRPRRQGEALRSGDASPPPDAAHDRVLAVTHGEQSAAASAGIFAADSTGASYCYAPNTGGSNALSASRRGTDGARTDATGDGSPLTVPARLVAQATAPAARRADEGAAVQCSRSAKELRVGENSSPLAQPPEHSPEDAEANQFSADSARSDQPHEQSPSPSPRPLVSATQHAHPSVNALKRFSRRFYEPVELQVESLPAGMIYAVLILWYVLVISCLVVQVVPKAQWGIVNICGREYKTNMRHLDRWTSPCMSVADSATAPGMSTLTWTGKNLEFMSGKLRRYRRLVFSLPRSEDQTEKTVTYHLRARVSSGVPSSTGGVDSVTYPFKLVCRTKHKRCNAIRIPEEIVLMNPDAVGDEDISVSLLEVPYDLMIAATRYSTAVGIAYQKRAYTLGVVIWRYIFLLISVLHTLRFIVYLRFTSILYEQHWVIILQIALFWYLNPIFAVNIVTQPLPTVLAFMELRLPYYFLTVTVAYMFAVMTASMCWKQRGHISSITVPDAAASKEKLKKQSTTEAADNAGNSSNQKNTSGANGGRHSSSSSSSSDDDADRDAADRLGEGSNSDSVQPMHSVDKAHPRKARAQRLFNLFFRGRNVYDPPLWTKFITVVFIATVFTLDIIDSCLHTSEWASGSNSSTRFSGVLWAMIAVILFGALVCLCLLLYLQRYLGAKPYLESRPQQLACRVFLVIFFTSIIYYVLHFMIFFFLYNNDYSAIASRVPLVQLPAIMIASAFVNIMTLVYTTRRRNESVPVHASDRRWKFMVWPDTWYRWLSRHGGSQYIFFTEKEEVTFYRIQFEFRTRQYLAKEKRRRARLLHRHGGVEEKMDDDMSWRSEVASTLYGDGGYPSRPISRVPSDLDDDAGAGGAHDGAARRGNNSFTTRHLPPVPHHYIDPEEPAVPRLAAADPHRQSQAHYAESGGQDAAHPPAAATTTPHDVFSHSPAEYHTQASETSVGRQSAVPEPDTAAAAAAPPSHDPSVPNPLDSSGQAEGSIADAAGGAPAGKVRARSLPATPASTTLPSRRNHSFTVSHGRRAAHPPASNNDSILNMDHFSTYFLPSTMETPQDGDAGGQVGPSDHASPAGVAAAEAQLPGSAPVTAAASPQLTRARGGPSRTGNGEEISTDSAFGRSASELRVEGPARRRSRLEFQRETTMQAGSPAPRRSQSQLLQGERSTDGGSAPLQRPTDGGSRADTLPSWRSASAIYTYELPHARPLGGSRPRPAHVRALSLDDHNHSSAPGSRANSVSGGADRRLPPERQRTQAGEDDAAAAAPSQLRAYERFLPEADLRPSRRQSDATKLSRRRALLHSLTRARERIGQFVGAAEHTLLEVPVRRIDKAEDTIFDVAYRPFQSASYLPFFNLETAIDCYNLSWEAYCETDKDDIHSAEDESNPSAKMVRRTIKSGLSNAFCECCPVSEDEAEEAELEEEELVKQEDAEVLRLENADQDTARRSRERDTDSRAGDTSTAPEETHQATDSAATAPREEAETAPLDVPRTEGAEGGSMPMRAERHRRQSSAGRDSTSLHAEESWDMVQVPVGLSRLGMSTTSSTRMNGPSPPKEKPLHDRKTLAINVEKYGYVKLLVDEVKEVQVLIAKLDLNAPEHRGKAPRIVISFRGTANMSNAKYDVNLHRIVWKEMEDELWRGHNRRSSSDGRANGASHSGGGAGDHDDDDDDMDGDRHSAEEAQKQKEHVGCGSCWASLVRKTSARPTCHAGFLTIWLAMRRRIISHLLYELRKEPDTVYRLFVTGHSLGGALASLCAFSVFRALRRVDYPITDVTVYTYGQPRLGNRTFRRVYNKAVPRSFRVMNESDMVVTMTTFGGFHVGIEVDIDRNGNHIVQPTQIEKLFPPTKGRGLTISNHFMVNYGVSLNAIAEQTPCPARGLKCYLTADPEKIVREEARDEALRQMQLEAQKDGGKKSKAKNKANKKSEDAS